MNERFERITTNRKIKKYAPLLLLPIALFLCLGLWWMSLRYSQTFIDSNTAVFDLRAADFTNQFFEVDSTVEYVQDVFLSPEEFELRDDIQIGSVPETAKAVTMRIHLLVPDGRQYGICGYPVNYASSVYVNGKWLFTEGNPALTAEAELARESFRLFSAEPIDGVIEILVQTSSFSISSPSSGMAWTIGDYEQVRLYHFHRTLTDLTVMAWYVILAFLSLLLFLSLPGYKANGWLSILALVWFIRSGLTGTRPLFSLLPNLEWQLANTIEKLTTPATLILITLILHSAFPGALPKWLRRVSLSIAGIGALMYIALPLSFFFGTTKYVNLIMSSVLAAGLLLILLSTRRKPIALPQKIMLAGLAVILIAFLWDSAYFGPLFKGLFIFSLTQPLMVTFSLFMATAAVLDTIRQSTEREVRLIEHVETQERELLEARIDIMQGQAEAYERLLLMLDAAPISCQLWGKDFNCIYCNDECVRFFHLDGKHEAHRLSTLEFVPENQPCGKNSLELATAYNKRTFAGERITFDWIQLIKGEHIPVEITLDTIKLSDKTYMTTFVRDLREQKRLIELENELMQKQIDIMLSQIQPHFLYNTLTAIGNLCRKDGEQAAKLVTDFSGYLRDNMDSLKQKALVRFTREMDHIKKYLDIEKVRFKERLNVVYDLQDDDFSLPILTIQPLVENAVRHGVTRKPSGGTVTIATHREPDWIRITVADDGVGFEPDAVSETRNEDGRSHVGIENVRSRLATQCGGTLTIESVKGVGTTATVCIPRKGQMNK